MVKKLKTNIDIILITIVTLSVFISIKIFQYKSFSGIGSEFVIFFESTLYNSIHGNLLLTGNTIATSHPSHFFAEHFSPIFFLLIPFYYLFPTPYLLLVLQGAVCALAVIPLYYLSKHFFKENTFVSITFCLVYFFSRIVNYGLIYEFHEEIFYPLLFLCVFLFLQKEKWIWFYLFFFLALSIKEDASFVSIGLGIYMFVRGNRRHGITVILISILWLLSSVIILIPYFRELYGFQDYKFISYWSHYGETKSEIILNMLNPIKNIEFLFSERKPLQMFNLFSVFLFLPFFSISGLFFLVLPNWFILYSSNYTLMHGPIIYYGLLITPFLFYVSIVGLNNLKNKFRLKNRGLIIISSVLLLVNIANCRYFKIINDGFIIPERYRSFDNFLNLIPEGTTVIAQESLISHVPPENNRILFEFKEIEADYIIIDKKRVEFPFKDDQYSEKVSGLNQNPNYDIILENDGIILFKKKQ